MRFHALRARSFIEKLYISTLATINRYPKENTNGNKLSYLEKRRVILYLINIVVRK